MFCHRSSYLEQEDAEAPHRLFAVVAAREVHQAASTSVEDAASRHHGQLRRSIRSEGYPESLPIAGIAIVRRDALQRDLQRRQ